MQSVARDCASRESSSAGGMGVRPGVRVRMTVCATSGAVNSTRNAAAAAWNELMPGTTS